MPDRVGVEQDAFDTLMEAAVKWAVLVDDASKAQVAALLADYAGALGPTARRVIGVHVSEHDSDNCWLPALRALSRQRGN